MHYERSTHPGSQQSLRGALLVVRCLPGRFSQAVEASGTGSGLRARDGTAAAARCRLVQAGAILALLLCQLLMTRWPLGGAPELLLLPSLLAVPLSLQCRCRLLPVCPLPLRCRLAELL